MFHLMKSRTVYLILILLLTPLGFAAKLYPGPLAWWVNDYFGGFLYVIFWCLAAALFFSKANAWKLAIWVLGITCFLECLQLWHPPVLEWVRSFFIGRTLIGTTFVLMDFPYYIAGSIAGALLIRVIQKKTRPSHVETQKNASGI